MLSPEHALGLMRWPFRANFSETQDVEIGVPGNGGQRRFDWTSMHNRLSRSVFLKHGRKSNCLSWKLLWKNSEIWYLRRWSFNSCRSGRYTSGTSRGYCFTGLEECSRGHTIDYMQWKWEKKNKKQLISGRAGADWLMKLFILQTNKQKPGHVFSPFVATERSMDQLAPFCKPFTYTHTKKTKATCSWSLKDVIFLFQKKTVIIAMAYVWLLAREDDVAASDRPFWAQSNRYYSGLE